MSTADFDAAPRFHIPVALPLLALLAMTSIVSAAGMLLAQG